MNIVLETYYSRVSKKIGYTIYKDGKTTYGRIRKCRKDKVKDGIFESLYYGLLGAKEFVSHEDSLIIVIQNQHAVNWLKERDGYQGYELWFEKAIAALDTLDCQYKFVYRQKYDCMKYVKDTGITYDNFVTAKEIIQENIKENVSSQADSL